MGDCSGRGGEVRRLELLICSVSLTTFSVCKSADDVEPEVVEADCIVIKTFLEMEPGYVAGYAADEGVDGRASVPVPPANRGARGGGRVVAREPDGFDQEIRRCIMKWPRGPIKLWPSSQLWKPKERRVVVDPSRQTHHQTELETSNCFLFFWD
jgi:hypothetical protein